MTPAEDTVATSSTAGGDILAISFGVAVVQWAAGYLCRMPPAICPAPVLLGLLVLIQLGGGYVLGRKTNRSWLGAIVTGSVIAVINLLVLGSVLAEEPEKAAAGAAGFLAGSIVLTVIGFAIGKFGRGYAPMQARMNWTGAFAKVAVLATLVLIVAGGLVTGWEAGLAVPDWPRTEGALMFLYPLSKMTGGIYFEHAHRLYGALVGLTTIALTVHLWAHPSERSRPMSFPRYVRWVAIVATILVIVQGVMGGLRVTELSTGLGIVHGMTAQVFLCVMVAIAAFVSTTWNSEQPREMRDSALFDYKLSVIAIGALLIQLGLGAAYRHLSSAEDAGPGVMHILWTHLAFAVIVLVIILVTGLRASAKYPNIKPIRASGKALSNFLVLQIVLGVIAVGVVLARAHADAPSAIEVWVTTAHQAIGATLLATTVLYAAWLRRCVTAGSVQ